MLNLVCGRSGSGKTEYVRGVLGDLAKEGQDRLLLIVPEQYSYDTERAMLERFGNRVAQKVEVVSFSRLADYVFRTTGGNAGLVADDGTKLILMLKAMNAVADKLDYYQKYREDVRLARELLAVYREVRQSGAGLLQLEETANRVDNTILSRKLSELFLIFRMYDALFQNRYADEDLQIEKLCTVLDNTQFLKGYTLAIDGFKSFTGQELQLLGRILSQAEAVYITLCTGGPSPSMVFASVEETKKRLRNMAEERSVPVYQLSPETTGLRPGLRYRAPELSFLEENLFDPRAGHYEEAAPRITIAETQTIFDECNYIAATIRKLLREEGLRARDIKVIVRNEEEYRKEMEGAFRRYSLPFFDDARQPVENQPLVVLCKAVLGLLARGFSAENLLQYVKTGLAGVSPEAAAELESYVFTWDLSGKAFLEPFTLNPFGLDAAFRSKEAEEEALGLLNHTRETVIGPLVSLRKAARDKSYREVGEALYHFFRQTHVPEQLKQYAEDLNNAGFSDLAGEQDRIWDVVISVIDRLTAVYGEEACPSLQVYGDLFNAILSATDLGNLPKGLDAISLSAADRVRLSSPNTVFVAGLEEGVFPSVIGSSGLFTLHERSALRAEGLELSFPEWLRASEERFIAYSAAAAPTERLYLSWHRLDASGSSYRPSELVLAVQNLFSEEVEENDKVHRLYQEVDAEKLPAEYYAETLPSIYQTYARGLHGEDPNVLESLREALTEQDKDAAYLKKLWALDRLQIPTDFQIHAPEVATELFGKNMSLSASRVDNYYHCAFQYFCRYGLHAEPRKRATLGANHYGTIIHYVLEQLLKETDKETFLALEEKELKERINHWLSVFAEEDLGGLSDKTSRFRYLYSRLSSLLYDIALRLQDELHCSDFVPTDFELSIGEGQAVDAYTLPLPDGGTLAIKGSVDRVDLCKQNGKTYVRVVDYKSGGKEFELSDILYGLNLQMLIYLFTLQKNGTGKYKDAVPAGILYYPAKRLGGSVGSRTADPKSAKLQDGKKNTENGLLLADTDVLEAMEHHLEGNFIPISRKRDGKLSPEKQLATLTELGKLQKRIDFLLQKMATDLQKGDIAAHPAEQQNHLPCQYCDYRAVCKQEEPTVRTIEPISREALMEAIETEVEHDAR